MSSKPRPIFTEMPWNIKQDIIDWTDFKTRCVLRKCSKALRNQVNNSDATLLPMKFIHSEAMVKVKMTNDDDDEEEIEVDYEWEEDGCLVNDVFIHGEHFIDRSVADFAAVARHPRTLVAEVFVEKEDFADLDEIYRFMRAFEKEFTHFPLRTESLQLHLELFQREQMRMLAVTRPGILKYIALEPVDENQDTSEIIASEHWKQAEEMLLGRFLNLPIQRLIRFPFWMIRGRTITLEDAKVFVEKIFEFGESFEEWHILYGELEPEALNYFLSEFTHRTVGDKHYFFKKMPGTVFHLRIRTKPASDKTLIKFSKRLSSEVGV